MSEIDLPTIKRKSLRGMVALVQRTFILQIIGIVGTLFLAQFLGSEALGVFGVVNAIIAFLGYFSDVGLAGALIQKKERITREDLQTTFTIQQILVGTAVGIGLVISSWIGSWYRLDASGVWLLRALMVSFFLSSLKTIPSILLERSLDFQKLVVPQIVETIVFNGVSVFLAWQGFGVWSFTWGALCRGLVGLITMYLIAPWRISFGVSLPVARRLFRFGIPFQSNSFLALLKDDLLFLFLGRILPLHDMGYIFLAKKLSELPLRMIMDNVMRVTFPAFSRLQHDAVHLRKALEKTTFGISFFVFPLYTGMVFFIRPFIEVFPQYQKWEEAVVSFYFLCGTSVAASLSTPLTNALNAIGKISITLGFMIFWIILTWLFVLYFVSLFGFTGFSIALFTISITVILVVIIVKRYIPFSFFSSIKIPLLGALAQAGLYAISIGYVPHTLFFLVPLGIAGLLVYGGVLWYFEHRKLSDFIVTLRGK